MTRQSLIDLMTGTGIYFDPDHPDHIEDKKITGLSPPFLEFHMSEVPFGADDIIYYSYYRITVRLYTDEDVCESQDAVESALSGFYHRHTSEYNNDLGLWETTYTFSDKKEQEPPAP